LTSAYAQSRARLTATRENLRKQSAEAVEELKRQIKRAEEQLEIIARRLEKNAETTVEAALGAAAEAERTIELRLRRIEARVLLLQAKGKINGAVHAVKAREFLRADILLTEGGELVRSARDVLGDDHAYEELIDILKTQLREAISSTRVQAQTVQAQIERVLSDADRLIETLEIDETAAEKQASEAENVPTAK
jgi:hypothetical protein